jgi:hypothetical protein
MRQQFRIEVAYLIAEFTYIIKQTPEWLTKLEELIEPMKKALAQAARARSVIVQAVPELRSAISTFGKYCEGDESIDVACRRLDGIQSYLPTRDELEGWVEKMFGKAPISAGSRGRGRPMGSSYPGFHDFLCRLLVTVNSEGGGLSHNKNYPTRGTLVRVLDLLRPILPPGFIPYVPPVRVLLSALKIAREAEPLEAILLRRYRKNNPYFEFSEKLFAELERNEK